MEKLSYACCEETMRQDGTDIVQYQGKNYKITFHLPIIDSVRKLISIGQKIAKIKISENNIEILGFED